MSYANIITQEPRTLRLPGGVYGDTDYHGSPPWGVAYAAGWRMLDPREGFAPPDGERVVGYTYAQDPARPDYAIETPITAAIPVLFPSPDITVPVLDATGAQTGTARLLVDHAGALVIVTDSASPQRPVADQIAQYVALAASLASERVALAALVKALSTDTRLSADTRAAAAGMEAKQRAADDARRDGGGR